MDIDILLALQYFRNNIRAPAPACSAGCSRPSARKVRVLLPAIARFTMGMPGRKSPSNWPQPTIRVSEGL